MLRLFVGVPLPEAIRDRLAGLRAGLPGAKWVAPENMHLSLRFVGEVPRHQAEDIDHALAAVRGRPFDMTLAGVDFFGTGDKVRVLWVGVRRSDALMHLQDKVESAVVRTGLDPERRKFKPHVTLARFKGRPGNHVGAYVENHDGFTAGPFPVDHFVLFRSHLGREGAHYEVLAEYPLDQV